MFWVTFIAEGRSGHTIVSSIIGDHKHARISDEQKYISRWYYGKYTADQIMRKLHNSGYGRNRGRISPWPTLLRYEEPLMVVGDKIGWEVPRMIMKRKAPDDVISKFSEAMDLPVKVIHVSRNPRQNIANWYHSDKYKRLWGEHSDGRMRFAVRRYAAFYDAAEKAMKDQDVLHLRHEELILHPTETIIELMNFLELPNDKEHRRAAKKHLFKKIPLRETPWNEKWDKEIADRIINRFSSLEYYRS